MVNVSCSKRERSQIVSRTTGAYGLTDGNFPEPIPKLNLNILPMLSKRFQPSPNLLPLLCPQRLRSLHQVDRLERRTRERWDGVECLRHCMSEWRCACTGRLTRSISSSSVPRPGPSSMIRTFSGRPWATHCVRNHMPTSYVFINMVLRRVWRTYLAKHLTDFGTRDEITLAPKYIRPYLL